jgi:esterase/lipase superfamily enzyme
MAANPPAPLPTFAVINYDVARDAQGHVVTDPATARLEFHANMKPSMHHALLVFGIEDSGRTDGGAPIYTARVIDPDNVGGPHGNAARRAGANSNNAGGPQPETTVFFIHGFNSNPTGVFEGWRAYQNLHPNREVVPVIWADHQIGICGYTADKLCRVDPAAHSLSDLVNIANNWAFPKRTLVCHSMGNFVLRRLARYVAQTPGANLAFDDIFMVSADVSAKVFDRPGCCSCFCCCCADHDGTSVLELANYQVHVLHSGNDRALQARILANCFAPALGAHGYSENARLPDDAGGNKLTQQDCSDRPCADPSGHGYQFEAWAVTLYETTIASRVAAAAAAPPGQGPN